MRRQVITGALLVALCPVGAAGQASGGAGTDDPVVETTVRALEVLQAKVLAMAQDFPAELFDFRPHPDSRSFAQEIWHVTTGYQVIAAQLSGRPLTEDVISSPAGAERDRDTMIAHLSAAGPEVTRLLRSHFDPLAIRRLAHLSEHYGKLVTLYRVNGLVPPASREP